MANDICQPIYQFGCAQKNAQSLDSIKPHSNESITQCKCICKHFLLSLYLQLHPGEQLIFSSFHHYLYFFILFFPLLYSLWSTVFFTKERSILQQELDFIQLLFGG